MNVCVCVCVGGGGGVGWNGGKEWFVELKQVIQISFSFTKCNLKKINIILFCGNQLQVLSYIMKG